MSNQNMPVVLPASMQNLVFAPPAELADTLYGNFLGAYEDFSSQYRQISLKGNRFTLKEGQSSEVYPNQHLPVVILGMAHDNHCLWFNNPYSSQNEDAAPAAVWWEKQGAPGIVPGYVLTEKKDGRNQYQIKRRLAVAILRSDPNTGEVFLDLENPYVLDVGSASIYGKDYPETWAFTLVGLIRLCARMRVMPVHFISTLVFDPRESVPVIRFVPYHTQQGQISYLDAGTLQRIYAVAASPTVTDMLRVKLLPEPGAFAETASPASTTAYAMTHDAQPQPAQTQALYAQPDPGQVYATQPAAPQAQPVQQPVYQSAPQPASPYAQSMGATAFAAPQPQATPANDNLMAEAAAARAQAEAMMAQAQASAAPTPPPAMPATPEPQPAPAAPQNQTDASVDDAQSALDKLLAAAGSYGTTN